MQKAERPAYPWQRIPGLFTSISKLNIFTQRLIITVFITIIAIALHGLFFLRAPVAVDEPIYTQTAYNYAQDFRNGNIGAILQDNFNPEHPVLTKLLFSGAILLDWQIRDYNPLPPAEQYQDWNPNFQPSTTFSHYVRDARLVSVLFGVLLVALLTWFNPLAGAFATVSTVFLSYTTYAYLEAPSLFFFTTGIILYQRAVKQGKAERGLLLAGTMTGLATAGKYYYALFGLLLVLDWFITSSTPRQERIIGALKFLVVGLAVFSLADMPFWTQGLPAALNLVSAHGLEYGSGWSQVSQSYNSSWYSGLTMLTFGFTGWHKGYSSPFLLNLDPLILALALLGLAVTIRRFNLINLWLISSLILLLFYPVKYPQYTILAIIPACICAATAISWLWERREIILNRKK